MLYAWNAQATRFISTQEQLCDRAKSQEFFGSCYYSFSVSST
ncbi:MAG: hypothetical protein RID53_17785 [Coleofasciculus sp. B1-GNL1-01]